LRYEAVLFDFDGVLADTEPLHYRCWREVLEPLGITFDWSYYRVHGIGTSDKELLARLARLAPAPLPDEALWARYEHKQRLFLERALADPPIPVPTRELIRSLDGLKLGVVTSTSRREVLPLLTAAGLREAFQVLVCAEDVERHKPDPEPYLKAAAALKTERVLVVEDSEAGAAAGRAAGLEVLRVARVEEVAELLRRRLGL